LRARYRKSTDGDLIVAMAGGGADADALFDTLLSAVPHLAKQRRCVVVIVTGPFLPSAERRALVRRASGLPVHVIKSVSDSMGYLGAADLVVAMAGYNTTAEILSLGQRALLVPRSGPSAEQQMRARLFAERGWVRWLAPELLSPSTLADAMAEALTTPLAPPVAPDLNGRSRVAHLLLRGQGAETKEPAAAMAPSESALTEVLPVTAAPELAEQR
jgi:predicted glycosyltransferase